MKTYTKTEVTTVNLLEISFASDTRTPREWDNIGSFIVISNKYNSPDTNEELINLVNSTSEYATSTANHIELMQKELDNYYIVPISTYEHGNIIYSIGTSKGFDCSNNGFYFVNISETEQTIEEIEKIITSELDTYSKWCNSEVYEFILYDSDGEIEDSCCGYYDLEDIKSELPKEWKEEDLSDYII